MTVSQRATYDLLVLTADSHQRAGVQALLETRRSELGIRPISFEVHRHPRSDPGVYRGAAEFLRPFLRTHQHALVLLDAAWEGAPSPNRIGSTVLGSLCRNGWRERSAVVVLDPEIETWCWVHGAPAVEAVVGLPWPELRRLGEQTGHWSPGSPKPAAPKDLLELALRKSRTPISAGLYGELAKSLPLVRCTDPAFTVFRDTLARWFGPAR